MDASVRSLRLAGIVMTMLAVLGVAACARRDGALQLAAPAPGVDTVDMLAATTRAPTDRPGEVFSGDRGTGLALANIVVSIPPSREVGSIQWPRSGPGDPTREFAVLGIRPLKPSAVGTWFRTAAHGKRRVLVFVHGFNTRFDAAVFRFAQFVHDSRADVEPVLFSWPSRGRVLDYVYDRESTNFSRSDLATVLDAAASSPDVDDVVVMAHSMGAWLTVEALRQEALRRGRIPAKISNVILASPDLDIDVFERQIAEMGPKRPHFTIFVSRNDHALGLSRLIAGRVTRVGAIDLTDPAYRERLEAATGIVVLDLTALRGGDSLNHSKFATSPEMVQLLGERLLAGQVIDSSDVDGTGAVQAVGNAVGTLITAPIMVFNAGRD